MIDFKTLQSNSLVSYTTLKPKSMTNPINLSQKETQIFDLFKEIIKENNLENIELRVVGGWVRDHLLNATCNDLDITIKGIDPNIFAQLINEKVNKNKNHIKIIPLKTSNGVEINLAKIIIYDVMIDFVELKENAFQDSIRRDFTFNALFYNILENKIEDLLKMGISDLKNGLIRSCATTIQKIDYDSFHILRMLRFATKYQYIIDDKYLSDIEQNKALFQDNLLNKTSKEKIKKEMHLIFSGQNPSFAIYSLYKLDLLKYVLQIKSDYKNKNKNILTEKDILNCVNIFIVGKKIFDKYQSYFEAENYNDNYKCAFYSILLTIHLRNFTDFSTSVANIILSKTLKLDSKWPLKIIHFFDDFNNFIAKNEYNKLNVGLLLRKILVRNISTMIFVSASYEYVMKINSNTVLDNLDDIILEKVFQKYYEFYKYMKKENLENVDEMKPIIDGKQLKKEYPGIPLKYIGEIINLLISKQIEINNFSEEDAMNVIKSKIEELKII